MKVYITKEILGDIITLYHAEYLRGLLDDVSHLYIEKFDSIWRIHEYPYLIIADLYGENEGFVVAIRVHGIGGNEEDIDDLRKWCIDNYIIKVSTDAITFRYNTDYFTHFSFDEEWVNTLFKIYARIVQRNTQLYKEELFKQHEE